MTNDNICLFGNPSKDNNISFSTYMHTKASNSQFPLLGVAAEGKQCNSNSALACWDSDYFSYFFFVKLLTFLPMTTRRILNKFWNIYSFNNRV